MKIKKQELIDFLDKQNKWITAKECASFFTVSDRSIKNYILSINQEFPNLILSSNKGYCLNKEQHGKFNNINITNIPQSPDERIAYILNLLIRKNEMVNIYDLSAILYVSDGTLKNDMIKIRKKIYSYHLELVNQSETYHISGLEKNKRKLISSLLWEESNEKILSLDVIQSRFPDIDIHAIDNIINKNYNAHNFLVNDYALANLILHVSIAIDRIRNEQYSNLENDIYPDVSNLTLDITKDLQEKFNITLPPKEISDMDLLFGAYTTCLDYYKITNKNISQYIPPVYIDLTKELIATLQDQYYIAITDEDFFVRFALHIKNLVNRANSNHLSKNPLTNTIRQSWPQIYDCAVTLALKLQELAQIVINDDEIAYIAFHIGNILASENSWMNKLKATLLIPKYYNYNIELAKRIQTKFNDSIVLTQIINSKEEYVKDIDTDILITTIDVYDDTSIEVCYISPFLSEKDSKILDYSINKVKKMKKQKKFEENIEQLIHEDFFEKNHFFNNEKECIHYICNKLLKSGYVDTNFFDEVIQRERISSTVFNKVAIPHTIKFMAKKTILYIILNEKPITWGNKEAQIIFLLAISNDNKQLFTNIFNDLSMILTDSTNFKKIINCNSHRELVELLKVLNVSENIN